MRTGVGKLVGRFLRLRLGDGAEPVLRALKMARDEYALARRTRRWRVAFEHLRGQMGLKVNFGCGPNPRPGWVNIDPFDPAAEFRWDARRALPFEDGVAEILYSEHMFEHLAYPDAVRFLRESHRVLRAGGLFRVVLPDFARAFDCYLRRDASYFDLLRGWTLVGGQENENQTLIDFLNYAVYQFGEHLCLWDEEKLIHELQRAGFTRVEPSAFDPAYDSAAPYRTRYSLYLNAVR